MAADRSARVLQGELCRVGAEGDAGPFAGGLARRVGDLAAADEDRRARIDHLASVSISSALNPASASTLLVCSPRLATFGPLSSFDSENRKGGAGAFSAPALSSMMQSERRW